MNEDEVLKHIDNIRGLLNSPDPECVSLGYTLLLDEEWFKTLEAKHKYEHCAWGYTFEELLKKMNPIAENADFWNQLNETATKTLKDLFWEFIIMHKLWLKTREQ